MRIGLTGGLASGKSTVAQRLRAAGMVVIDADEVVKGLYRPGMPGADAVRDLFGPEYLDASGAVDTHRLADRVFADPEALERLERRIHPLVRRAYERLADGIERAVVLEGTLIVEAGFAPSFDLLVTVEAPEELRLERAVSRGMSRDQARARMATQGDGERRRAAADIVIDNAGSRAQLEQSIEDLIATIRLRGSAG